MHLSPEELALNMQLTSAPMDADLHTYGFPPGYFVVKNVATDRLLDVESDMVEDGTPLILFPETENSLVEGMRRPESNNQVFFIDTSGALCSRSSGHAIDIENGRLVLRHRRPVSHPFPNAYSHPLPRFSFDPDTKRINVAFAFDPSFPTSARATALSTWKEKLYFMTSIPMRKPRSLIDNASELLSSAISVPFSLFTGHASPTAANPGDVFDSGEIELREDEILETERSEEGEVDDSPERFRQVRVIGVTKEEEQAAGERANARRQWIVVPLRSVKSRTVQ